MQMSYTLANIFGGWGFIEFAMLAIVGVLVFGKRLPEVGKNLGRSIVEFKKGLTGAGEALAGGNAAEQPPQPQALSVQTRTVPLLSGPADPSIEEQLRKQEQEVRRLSEEVRQLRQPMAQKDQNDHAGPA